MGLSSGRLLLVEAILIVPGHKTTVVDFLQQCNSLISIKKPPGYGVESKKMPPCGLAGAPLEGYPFPRLFPKHSEDSKFKVGQLLRIPHLTLHQRSLLRLLHRQQLCLLLLLPLLRLSELESVFVLKVSARATVGNPPDRAGVLTALTSSRSKTVTTMQLWGCKDPTLGTLDSFWVCCLESLGM